jgi:hypothetical protein
MKGKEKKICNCCGEEKMISDFYELKTGKDGHYNSCKICYNKKGESKETRKNYYQNPQRIIANRFRGMLRNTTVKKSEKSRSKIVKYLGCSFEKFKNYIEKQFVDGMNWNNHGSKNGIWEFDHIVPLSHYDLRNENEIYKAFNYTNIRPLLIVENRMKGNKI